MNDALSLLGRDGAKLEALAAPFLTMNHDDAENVAIGHEQPFDAPTVLGDRLSPELRTWIDRRLAPRLGDEGRAPWVPGGCARLFAASRAEDAQWMIRLQSIFLPVSSVRLRGETYVSASWHPTAMGTSRVYITHQDEPGVWRRHASLAGLVARTLADDEELDIDEATRTAWREADASLDEADDEDFPEHLDPERLQLRTRWIGELLIGQHVSMVATANGLYYDRLEGMPSFETYLAERPLLADWPHLQAYWLTHHILLRNREAVAEVLALADDRYPPIPELRIIAEAFDAGGEPRQLVGFGPHQALRRDVVRKGIPAMAPSVVAEVQAELDAQAALLEAADVAREALEARTDEVGQKVAHAWSLAGQIAGMLTDAERMLLQEWCEPREADRMSMRVTTGETTPLIRLYNALLQADAPTAPLFEASFTAAATLPEDHADAAPGSLVGWGAAVGSFATVHQAFRALCKSAGRLRYLELAMLADRYFEDDGAEAFLVSEVDDFLGDLGDFEYGTTSFALFALLDRLHPGTVELANAVLAKGPMTGGSWGFLLQLAEKASAPEMGATFVEGLEALVRRGMGRHDDGTRAEVMRAWARAAGASAVEAMDAMRSEISDVRKEAEEAALLVGMLTAQPGQGGALQRAPGLLDELVAKGGSMYLGAAVELLMALEATGAPDTAALEAKVRPAVEADRHVGDVHKAWLARDDAA
jgi:hypothetical protein